MSREGSPLRDRMIFLVGARRSGTNWLQRVVGAHPAVAVVPSETYLFSRGVAPLEARFHHGVRGSPGTGFIYMDQHELVDSLREFCDRALAPFLRGTPGASRLAERTPEHVTCLDLIGRIYPDSHVVHIVRDGRDVARSLLNQDWPSAPRTIEKAAEEWRFCIEAAESAAPSLERYRVVRYEELLADPLTHVTELYGWLGLPGGPGLVEAALVEADVRFNVSPGAAIAAEKWRESFTDADLEAFNSVAGDTLKRLGYDVTSHPAGDDRADREPKAKPKRMLRRREKASADHDPSFERRVSSMVTETQRMMDRVVTAVNTRDVETLGGFMTDRAWVRLVSPDGEWKGRGPAAWSRLADAIRSDGVLAGKQTRGDLYPALPASTAVMYFETPDGSQHVRAVAVTTQGDRIARFTYYQVPPVR